MPNVIRHRRIVSSKDPDVLSLLSDIDKLKNNEIKITYFEPIVSSTGTITLPGQATILLDQFEGGVDAYVSTISNGKPTGEFPIDGSGNQVDVSYFDALGNYTLTSIPTVFPVALIYIFKIKLIDYQNVDLNYIIEEDEIGGSSGNINYRYETTNTTLLNLDDIIDCNGTLTITLPLKGSISKKTRVITNSSLTTNVTINASGVDLIYDEPYFILYPGESIDLINGDTNWQIG